jgi:hypothetical protein
MHGFFNQPFSLSVAFRFYLEAKARPQAGRIPNIL